MDTNGNLLSEHGRHAWLTTNPSAIQRAKQRAESPDLARQALGELCVTYWYPVYAFIRRWRNADTAEDLTQAFFADLLARGIDTYDSQGVPFRPWLRGAVRHFILRDKAYWKAQMRDPRKTVWFDGLEAEQRYQLEPRHGVTPERLFERSFGYRLIEAALTTTRQQYAARNDVLRFDTLRGFVSMGEFDDLEYAPAAAALGISVGAARRAALDLRGCFRANLRAEVRRIVPRQDLVDDELKYLYQSMRLPEESWSRFVIADNAGEPDSDAPQRGQSRPVQPDAH